MFCHQSSSTELTVHYSTKVHEELNDGWHVLGLGTYSNMNSLSLRFDLDILVDMVPGNNEKRPAQEPCLWLWERAASCYVHKFNVLWRYGAAVFKTSNVSDSISRWAHTDADVAIFTIRWCWILISFSHCYTCCCLPIPINILHTWHIFSHHSLLFIALFVHLIKGITDEVTFAFHSSNAVWPPYFSPCFLSSPDDAMNMILSIPHKPVPPQTHAGIDDSNDTHPAPNIPTQWRISPVSLENVQLWRWVLSWTYYCKEKCISDRHILLT